MQFAIYPRFQVGLRFINACKRQSFNNNVKGILQKHKTEVQISDSVKYITKK
jgi:hypothetical protein